MENWTTFHVNRDIGDISHLAAVSKVLTRESKTLWSPTGIARGTLLHARVGRHLPTIVGTHSSTGKARGFLLPG